MNTTAERAIESVLTTVRYQPEDLAELHSYFPGARITHLDPKDDAGIQAALQHVDVAILAGDLDERYLQAPNLRWIHCDHAGLARSARPEVFERGILLSGSAGRSTPALAEHVFYFALALTYRVRTLIEQQDAHHWQYPASYGAESFALAGRTMGIIGFGHIGQAVARRARAFEMPTIVYRRRAGTSHSDVDEMLSADAGDDLTSLLERSDVVVLTQSLSDETHKMIGAPQLASMKSEAFIINMGRGALIDQDALVEALRSGTIAGAGLDVTDPEPLPADSELWDLPSVLITPHATPPLRDRTQRAMRIIAENVRRYRAGEPLLNQLSGRDVYTH